VRGWPILTFTLLTGFILGVGAATMGPALVAPYLPKSISGQSERIEGEVLRKQREANRLLLKVATAQGAAGPGHLRQAFQEGAPGSIRRTPHSTRHPGPSTILSRRSSSAPALVRDITHPGGRSSWGLRGLPRMDGKIRCKRPTRGYGALHAYRRVGPMLRLLEAAHAKGWIRRTARRAGRTTLAAVRAHVPLSAQVSVVQQSHRLRSVPR
jgi:hypothetical protein